MSARTLLERIEYPEAPGERDRADAPDEALASIQRNLQRVLNAHRGFSPAAPDFGLTDVVETSLNSANMGRLEEDLKKTIERYEPRLARVQVRYASSTDAQPALRFDVFGQFTAQGQSRPARFRTTLEASGELSVKRS